MSLNKILDKDLTELKRMLQTMIEETKIQYANCYAVIKHSDIKQKEVVYESDSLINTMQNEFISTAMWKISKQKLVARDLRLAIGGILISVEIKRIAEYSKHVCDFFTSFHPTKKYASYIITMFQLVIDMLDDTMELFENYKEENIEAILNKENEINEKFKEVYKYLVKQIKKTDTDDETYEIAEAMKQIKNLERAGDHLLLIKEIFTFMKKGKFENYI